eukprot:9381780-Pyramimonas_sp.AAC.1
MPHWAVGSQLVALNFQNIERPMRMNQVILTSAVVIITLVSITLKAHPMLLAAIQLSELGGSRCILRIRWLGPNSAIGPFGGSLCVVVPSAVLQVADWHRYYRHRY